MSNLEDIKARVAGHTPGPWRFDADGWLEAEPPSVHGYVISPGPYDHDEVQRLQIEDADGVLIAAAPKLLAALEVVELALADLDKTFDGPEDEDKAIRVISETLRRLMRNALA